jgi:hypothetical protein
MKSEREAKLLVATWNVRVIRHSPVWFFPTIRAALTARRFYLGCLCPGCGQRGSVDLRRVNRDPRRLARKPDPNAVLPAVFNLYDENHDLASASLLKNWIDEAEGRTWFLFEAARRAEGAG